jgi:hypothetical protein
VRTSVAGQSHAGNRASRPAKSGCADQVCEPSTGPRRIFSRSCSTTVRLTPPTGKTQRRAIADNDTSAASASC